MADIGVRQVRLLHDATIISTFSHTHRRVQVTSNGVSVRLTIAIVAQSTANKFSKSGSRPLSYFLHGSLASRPTTEYYAQRPP